MLSNGRRMSRSLTHRALLHYSPKQGLATSRCAVDRSGSRSAYVPLRTEPRSVTVGGDRAVLSGIMQIVTSTVRVFVNAMALHVLGLSVSFSTKTLGSAPSKCRDAGTAQPPWTFQTVRQRRLPVVRPAAMCWWTRACPLAIVRQLHGKAEIRDAMLDWLVVWNGCCSMSTLSCSCRVSWPRHFDHDPLFMLP